MHALLSPPPSQVCLKQHCSLERSALSYAAWGNSEGAMRVLLNQGFDPQHTDA